jgi:hypothetical protein
MAFLVIAYPELNQNDLGWVQEYRKRHDKQFTLVKPHFSLVFAIHDIGKEDFLAEVRKRVVGVKAFDFDVRVATINQDDSGNYYHEFLVPDSGYSDIVMLHDRLYSGLFAKHLRFDINFIPHISIGDGVDPQTVKQRVDELNGKTLSLHGRIGSIDVIEYVDSVFATQEKITLQN